MEYLKLRTELASGILTARHASRARRACASTSLAWARSRCCLPAAAWTCTSSRSICRTSRPTFFADGRSERQPVPGTVARGQLRLDELMFTGRENGVVVDKFPFPITKADLRGRLPVPVAGRAALGRGDAPPRRELAGSRHGVGHHCRRPSRAPATA